jgi:hypothetical protein
MSRMVRGKSSMKNKKKLKIYKNTQTPVHHYACGFGIRFYNIFKNQYSHT